MDPFPAAADSATSTFSRIADLPVEVEEIRLPGLDEDIVVAAGRGATGRGEIVRGYPLPVERTSWEGVSESILGRWPFHLLSHRLDECNLTNGQRWAVETACLALGLAQQGRTLAEALGRKLRPVRFSLHQQAAGRPFEVERLLAWIRTDPGLRLSVDADPAWDDRTLAALAETGAVEVVDLHSYEEDPMPPPESCLRICSALPHALLEDPALVEETRRPLAAHPGGVSWDAAIYSTIEIEALDARAVNIRPARFATWRRLLDAYDHCRTHQILCYAGSSGEGPLGRLQLRYLAALFHPDAPNQTAPHWLEEADPERPPVPLLNPAPTALFESAFGRPH